MPTQKWMQAWKGAVRDPKESKGTYFYIWKKRQGCGIVLKYL